MKTWTQHDVQKHMHVISSDNQDIGHITDVYEDSFALHKGFLFSSTRYIPYSAITSIDNSQVHILMSADEAKETKWSKRPDYEDHPGDPLQLFYDRGHGIHDPFDETNPDKM